MPQHDYVCPSCGLRVTEFRTVAEGGRRRLPICPRHESHYIEMDWQPPTVVMDVYAKRGRTITAHLDGQVIEVNSRHQMRQLERDSEQRYRNGEGTPVRFPALSNEPSNMDQHSFTKDTGKPMDFDLKDASGGSVPFATDHKTQRGVPITAERGAPAKARGDSSTATASPLGD